MLKYSEENKKRSLIEEYSNMVVKSQLRSRADIAVNERDISSENFISLKSYLVSGLINRLLPDLTKTVEWAERFQADNEKILRLNAEQNDSETIVETMQSMLSFLQELKDAAHLEAGNLSIAYEAINLNDIIRSACLEAEVLAQKNGARVVFDPGFENLYLLGDRGRLHQMFSNIFCFTADGLQPDDEITVTTEKLSELYLAVVVKGPVRDLTEGEITRLLTSNKLVESTIAISSKNIPSRMPVAKAIAELHSGELSIPNGAEDGVFARITLPNHVI